VGQTTKSMKQLICGTFIAHKINNPHVKAFWIKRFLYVPNFHKKNVSSLAPLPDSKNRQIQLNKTNSIRALPPFFKNKLANLNVAKRNYVTLTFSLLNFYQTVSHFANKINEVCTNLSTSCKRYKKMI
jgi:hypothetical protein